MKVNTKEIEKKTKHIAEPIAIENNANLVDVKFVEEDDNWYLRIYIDKNEGVNISDCEKISKFVSKKLDQLDYIPHNYYLEVSSKGID